MNLALDFGGVVARGKFGFFIMFRLSLHEAHGYPPRLYLFKNSFFKLFLIFEILNSLYYQIFTPKFFDDYL